MLCWEWEPRDITVITGQGKNRKPAYYLPVYQNNNNEGPLVAARAQLRLLPVHEAEERPIQRSRALRHREPTCSYDLLCSAKVCQRINRLDVPLVSGLASPVPDGAGAELPLLELPLFALLMLILEINQPWKRDHWDGVMEPVAQNLKDR